MAHHGVMEQERAVGNRFRVDVLLRCPAAVGAAQTDSLDAAVNYAEVIALVREQMAIPSALLENVCWRIMRAIVGRFGDAVAGGRVSVAKLTPPCGVQVDGVAAALEW